MLPDPLHPAMVHLPIALSIIVPLLAVLATAAIATRFIGRRVWTLVVLLQALLAGSAWLAMETGEREEDRVERVVAERWIESHEEAAKTVVRLSAAGLAISAVGFVGGGVGLAGRVGLVVLSLLTFAATARTGSAGGELVYRHGAAMAYVEGAASVAAEPTETIASRSHHDHDEDDDDD
jgi:uncharacterized membrane protein